MTSTKPALGQSICAIALLALPAACADVESVDQAHLMAETIVMEGERLFPESLTSDVAGNVYIGSNPGIVFRAERGSETATPWIVPDAANGLQTVFGVLADDDRGLLWVCTNPAGFGPDAAPGGPSIKSFSLEDASLQASYDFPADIGPAMCNDMTIASNGDVYVSEMLGARILKLESGGEAFEPWAADPEFASIDGISFGSDGALYANSIQRNTLLRVGIEDNGLFDNVEVMETSQPLGGPDGLRPLDDGRLLQSEGNSGTVTLLTIPETGPVQVDVIASGIDYASAVTEVDGRAYYTEGKLSFMFDPNRAMEDPGDFVIRSVAIPVAE